MSIEAHKTAIRRAVSNFSAATLENYLQLYAADAKLHFLPPGLPQGVEGARLFYQSFLAAFPDARMTIDDFVAEADTVATRYSLEGTHQGEFMGVAPTGRHVTVSGISILRFNDDGKCVERWNEANLVSLLRQIGAMPNS
ncbi:MAG TPA: ester cyclase [Vicinamibacterales bacterium]|nr:ester cyclase [Vicinamibacterales bacterium]